MTDSEPEQEEPKIIVDDDWKEQVSKEKEIVGQEEQEPSASPPAEPANADGENESLQPPPASFEVLVTMMFTQAMSMLGQMPGAGGESKVNKPFAKHYIDTLDMLTEKTQGNLTDEEAKMLSEALHALRMMYVNSKG